MEEELSEQSFSPWHESKMATLSFWNMFNWKNLNKNVETEIHITLSNLSDLFKTNSANYAFLPA